MYNLKGADRLAVCWGAEVPLADEAKVAWIWWQVLSQHYYVE